MPVVIRPAIKLKHDIHQHPLDNHKHGCNSEADCEMSYPAAGTICFKSHCYCPVFNFYLPSLQMCLPIVCMNTSECMSVKLHKHHKKRTDFQECDLTTMRCKCAPGAVISMSQIECLPDFPTMPNRYLGLLKQFNGPSGVVAVALILIIVLLCVHMLWKVLIGLCRRIKHFFVWLCGALRRLLPRTSPIEAATSPALSQVSPVPLVDSEPEPIEPAPPYNEPHVSPPISQPVMPIESPIADS